MTVESKVLQNRKIKKTLLMLAIHVALLFIISVTLGGLIGRTGFELRTLSHKIIFGATAIWVIALLILCTRLCTLIYSYPPESGAHKVGAVVLLIAIFVVVISVSMINFVYFIFTVKDEKTIEFEGTTYITETVSYDVTPGGMLYYKAVNLYLYDKEHIANILSPETYTGIIRDWHGTVRESGNGVTLIVDTGEGKNIEFALLNTDMLDSSQEIPIGAQVIIKSERHPNPEYHPILSIEVT